MNRALTQADGGLANRLKRKFQQMAQQHYASLTHHLPEPAPYASRLSEATCREFQRDVTDTVLHWVARGMRMDPQELAHSPALREFLQPYMQWMGNAPHWMQFTGLLLAKKCHELSVGPRDPLVVLGQEGEQGVEIPPGTMSSTAADRCTATPPPPPPPPTDADCWMPIPDEATTSDPWPPTDATQPLLPDYIDVDHEEDEVVPTTPSDPAVLVGGDLPSEEAPIGPVTEPVRADAATKSKTKKKPRPPPVVVDGPEHGGDENHPVVTTTKTETKTIIPVRPRPLTVRIPKPQPKTKKTPKSPVEAEEEAEEKKPSKRARRDADTDADACVHASPSIAKECTAP